MRRYIKETFISITFFQVALTPYLFLWLNMDFDQYGRWCLLNMPISAVLGPALVALMRWFESDE